MKVKEIIADRSLWLTHPDYDKVNPRISVILPTYSRAKSGLLKKCIDSVLNQSFRRLELIIIDDASVDGTFDICKKYMENDARVSIIRHTANMALPAVSTYEAYVKARGEYIAYAFDDNQWELDALAKTYQFMEKNGVKASYGVAKALAADGKRWFTFGADDRLASESLWQGNFIGAGSVVLHKEVLETVGLHDPHLSLTRVCDWDLWQRIVERYDFVATKIPFTKELGITQPDSLGNSFKLDQWFLREYQQRRETAQLLPENYENCDVTEFSAHNSPYYLACLAEHYRQYEKKAWFSKTELENIVGESGDREIKRVLLLCSDMTNSLMAFTEGCPRCVCCFSIPGLFVLSFWSMADAVIFPREFFEHTQLFDLCKTLRIPCYYFTDDNFREIAMDNDCDMGIRQIAELTTAENLKKFAGIIVTTEPLREYFIKNKLHKNIIQLGAVYWPAETTRPEKEETLTVGFMGGSFREETLKECVLPALYRLAESRPLRLILPCTKATREKTEQLGTDQMEVVPFYRTNNYHKLLNFYRAQGTDILIHCGSDMRNNIYKTKNALLNAASIGAALIVSDIEPYCYRDTDEPENAYLLVRNTAEAWEEGLHRLVEEATYRTDVVQTAQRYCETHYGKELVWTETDKEFSHLPEGSLFQCIKRYDALASWIMQNGAGESGGSSNTGYRPYVSDNLSFSGDLRDGRRYGFTSGTHTIREIALLFGMEGRCTGTVTIQITNRQGMKLSENKLRIDTLAFSSYTNILLPEPISTDPKELLYLQITFDYEEKAGCVGLFEDKSRVSFIYRVFRKLGHPLPGKNVIFIDCRR